MIDITSVPKDKAKLIMLAKMYKDISREKDAAKKSETSLREFIKEAWHVVEPATPFVNGWHLDAIADHLEAVTNGHIRNLIINIPPRCMKSLSCCVFWPAWEWIRFPEQRWLFASYASDLSIRDSVKCRRVVQSPWYQRHWGDVYQLSGDQNAKQRFETTRGGARLSTSVGGVLTGEGGSRLVVDDPHHALDVHSDTMRQSAIDWWDQVMSTRGNNPKTVSKLVVMQRLHTDDLTGHLLERGGYEHLCLPMEYES